MPRRALRRPLLRWRRFTTADEIGLIVFVCVVAISIGSVNPYWERIAELVLIYALVSQALDLISGYGGQFSLGHSGLFAIGGYTSAILYSKAGAPAVVALLAAIAVSAIVGALLAGPSLLIGGLYLALVTLAFAFIVANVLNDSQSLTNGPTGLGPLQPQYSTYSVDRFLGNHYLVVVTLAMAISWVLMRRVIGSRWKRALIAIRESSVMAHAVGVRVNMTKIATFAISAAFTGLAGALYADLGYISPHDLTFQLSVSFLAIMFLGGIGTLVGSVFGAIILILVPEVLAVSAELRLVLYGLVLVLVMVIAPGGAVGAMNAALALVGRRHSRLRLPVGAATDMPATDPDGTARRRYAIAPTAKDSTALVASSVSKTYRGLRALQAASVSVRPGGLVGLIGPNGSGKTTFLNCIGGQTALDGGNIRLGNQQLAHKGPAARAEHGMFRTFQHGALCPTLSCRENVMLGGHREARIGLIRSLATVRARLLEESALADKADAILEYLGVPPEYHDRLPAELPYGLGRLIEIGVVLMARARIVLLDEPAAGLVDEEVARLEQVLRAMLDAGVGILLVEHHVQLVLNLAENVVVLDGGKTIAEGPPTAVVADEVVQKAYLGETWTTAPVTELGE